MISVLIRNRRGEGNRGGEDGHVKTGAKKI